MIWLQLVNNIGWRYDKNRILQILDLTTSFIINLFLFACKHHPFKPDRVIASMNWRWVKK